MNYADKTRTDEFFQMQLLYAFVRVQIVCFVHWYLVADEVIL